MQLLDTGFFHADPHPGNLIRTPDGKLAILDFGNILVYMACSIQVYMPVSYVHLYGHFWYNC